MPDIKTAIREMVTRIAKREVNTKIRPLDKKIKELNLANRNLLRIAKKQEKELALLSKSIIPQDKIKALPPEALQKSRLSSKLIAKLRKKLKLTRKEFGKLLGASSNTVFLWETGKSEPRPAYRAKIVSLRQMGKREIRQLLNDKPQA